MKALLLIIFGMLFVPTAAQAAFSDVSPSQPHYQAIQWAEQQGIVRGYSDGTFRPDATVNRAEFTKILLEAYNVDTNTLCRIAAFPDAPLQEWYGPYVHKARCLGIISGYSDGYFRPGNSINFAETTKIVALTSDSTYFEEERLSNPWFKIYMLYLGERDAIPRSIRSADQMITRGEMVEMMWRLQARQEDVISLPESSPSDTVESYYDVIVSQSDENGILQLYSKRDDGSNQRQITECTQGCFQPAWSPDGKNIAFVQAKDNSASIWITDPKGSYVKQVTTSGRIGYPAWLSDSKNIVYMVSGDHVDPVVGSSLHVVNIITLESQLLFDGEMAEYSNSMPDISSDGDRIAFVSNRNGFWRIWVSDLNGDYAQMVSEPDEDYDEEIDAEIVQKVPVWSPEGTEIAYFQGVEQFEHSSHTGIENPERDRLIEQAATVRAARLDGSHVRLVGNGDDPTYSPDGRITKSGIDSGPPPRVTIHIESNGGHTLIPIVSPGRNFGRFAWKPMK